MRVVLRQEKKYLMNTEAAYRLMGRFSKVLTEDSHNDSLGYPVRSLYFDTPFDDDFHDKVDGLEQRQKLRLRIYSPEADFAMLELKQKQGIYQRKRSLRLSKDEARALIKGEHDVLLQHREDFAAECYGLMSMKAYRPKAVVEYLRRAYVAKENSIRITFDSNIYATETDLDIFSDRLNMYPVLDPFNSVLEVKFNEFLLSYIKELLEGADRSELSVSKYCLARTGSLRYSI